MSRTTYLTQESFQNHKSQQDENFRKIDAVLQSMKQSMLDIRNDIAQIRGERFWTGSTFNMALVRLDRVESKGDNWRSNKPWMRITPVGVYRDITTKEMPAHDLFPATVRHFWRLQIPAQQHKLEYLVQFYNIENWRSWPQIQQSLESANRLHHNDIHWREESQESDSTASFEMPSMRNMIESYPLAVLFELAACLGLPFDKIHQFYEAADTFKARQASSQNAPKRPPPVTAAANSSKQTKLSLVDPPAKVDASQRPVRLPETPSRTLLEELLRRTSSSPSPRLSLDQDALLWNVEEDERNKAELHARMFQGRERRLNRSLEHRSAADMELPPQQHRDQQGAYSATPPSKSSNSKVYAESKTDVIPSDELNIGMERTKM